ncbi:MAG: acetylornithine transaminase [Clostridia bacterium]|nr:acetylornithine transaminase [Clostridia bacterium]
MSYIELDKRYIADTYARFPVEIECGKGSLLYGADGKEYIDMGSGIGVNVFGACDEGWTAAVTEQLNRLQHASNLYYTGPCAKLAEILCEKTGMQKVFFCNSGAEANECAIKAARKYAAEKHGDGCFTVATVKNSFHGRTLTTLAATGQERFHKLYNPLTPGFVSVSAEKPEELEALADGVKLAAVLIECVQGEGGVIPLSKEYVEFLREFTEKRGILLMTDEVQTGNGRTGKLYSYMNYGIVPDAVSTAKGLGGGLPIGAALLGEKLKDVFAPGDHGSTFGGNPVACAGAYYVISRLDDAFLAEVTRKGGLLKSFFENAEGISSVSGYGLMLGLKTEKDAREVAKECIQNGVLCLTAKDRVRLLPPLNTPDGLLLKAAKVIADACKGV